MDQNNDLLQNIQSLLSKDIFLPNEVVMRINLALAKMPHAKLVELLIILQDASSKKESFLRKLFSENANLNFEYKKFLTQQFNTVGNE